MIGHKQDKKEVEGADLLIYLAQSPPMATRKKKLDVDRTITQHRQEQIQDAVMEEEDPKTPSPKSNKYTTFPQAPYTPSQSFDFADYVNITPSPARPSRQEQMRQDNTHTPLSTPSRRKLAFA